MMQFSGRLGDLATIGVYSLAATFVLWGWTAGNALADSPEAASPEAAPSGGSSTVSISPDAVYLGRLPPNELTEEGGDRTAPLERAVDELKRDRDAMIDIRSSVAHEPSKEIATVYGERDKLKRQLHEMMVELARRPKPEKPPEATNSKQQGKAKSQDRAARTSRGKRYGTASQRTKPVDGPQSAPASGPVDSMGLALSLFRTGEYNGALKAFELAKKTATDPHDRIVIKYFSAACLGKLGNAAESTMLFREVANSKTDEALAECAQWQLSSQQWCDSTRARIAKLRAVQPADKVASSTTAVGGSRPAGR